MDAGVIEIKEAGIVGAEVARASLSERDFAEVLGAFTDVTAKLQTSHETLRREVVRLQAELSAANEQVERSRRLAALGEMAAGIAHEVRNPLGSIGLYARMLEDDLGDRPIEQGVARKIGAAVRGLNAVVGDVLAFAREMRVEHEAAEPEMLIAQAVEECVASDQAQIGEGRPAVSVSLRIDPEIPSVWCDSGLAHRALVNVVRNAIEAMRERGHESQKPRLEIRVERGSAASGPGVRVCVRDSGPGIPAEVLPRIFNPFYTTRATGTGLGLAIVHRIMDAHRGLVRVANVESDADDQQVGGAEVELVFPDMASAAVTGLCERNRKGVTEDAE